VGRSNTHWKSKRAKGGILIVLLVLAIHRLDPTSNQTYHIPMSTCHPRLDFGYRPLLHAKWNHFLRDGDTVGFPPYFPLFSTSWEVKVNRQMTLNTSPEHHLHRNRTRRGFSGSGITGFLKREKVQIGWLELALRYCC